MQSYIARRSKRAVVSLFKYLETSSNEALKTDYDRFEDCGVKKIEPEKAFEMSSLQLTTLKFGCPKTFNLVTQYFSDYQKYIDTYTTKEHQKLAEQAAMLNLVRHPIDLVGYSAWMGVMVPAKHLTEYNVVNSSASGSPRITTDSELIEYGKKIGFSGTDSEVLSNMKSKLETFDPAKKVEICQASEDIYVGRIVSNVYHVTEIESGENGEFCSTMETIYEVVKKRQFYRMLGVLSSWNAQADTLLFYKIPAGAYYLKGQIKPQFTLHGKGTSSNPLVREEAGVGFSETQIVIPRGAAEPCVEIYHLDSTYVPPEE